MPKIIDACPIAKSGLHSQIKIAEGESADTFADIRRETPFIWCSLTPARDSDSEDLQLAKAARKFPVAIDTGFNDTFLINPWHLTEWARLKSNDFPLTDQSIPFSITHTRKKPVTYVGGNLWIHPTVQGDNQKLIFDAEPLQLAFVPGFVIIPEEWRYFSLPLLGVKGLWQNKLLFELGRKIKGDITFDLTKQ